MSDHFSLMNTIPATAAKAHFPAILDRVDLGEEFVLTRHGKDAAYLGPSQRATTAQAAQAVADMVAWRSKVKTRGAVLDSGESTHSLISKGRR